MQVWWRPLTRKFRESFAADGGMLMSARIGPKRDVRMQLRSKTFARLAVIGIMRRLATMFMYYAGLGRRSEPMESCESCPKLHS